MATEISVGKPGEAFNIDEIYQIAEGNVKVTIDTKALTRIKKESPKPDQFKAEGDIAKSQPTQSASLLTPVQTRASLFCLLLRLINGFSGARAVILEVIASLLNNSQIALPAGESDEVALRGLCGLLKGDKNAGDDAARDLLGESTPFVSTAERLHLESGLPVSCGVLSVSVACLKKVLAVSSATLALTCEALRASTKVFDAKVAQGGANKHSAAVAAEVSCLLEGSTLTNAKAKDGGAGELSELPLVRIL
jgi:histidine ammonia-lyase